MPRCGNRDAHGKDKVDHPTVGDVRSCFARSAQAVPTVGDVLPAPIPSDDWVRTYGLTRPAQPSGAPERRDALSRPARGRTTRYPARSASEAQRQYIASLASAKETPPAGRNGNEVRLIARMNDVLSGKPVSHGDAGDVIDWLKVQPSKNVAEERSGTTPDIPAGYYAVRWSDGIVKFYRVDRPTKGRWAGRTFVKLQAGPEFHPIGKTAVFPILAEIARDLSKAQKLYASELGRCYVCNRELTDETSRELGIGPICRNK